MKKTKILLITVLLTAITIFAYGKSAAIAQDFISVTPGKSAIREFYIYDVFNYGDFSYGHYFVVGIPGIEEIAEDLSITITANPTKEFTGRVVYTLAGLGTTTNGGIEPVSGNGEVPGDNLTTTIAVNSAFGIYVMAVIIDRIVGEVEFPVPMTIKFDVSQVFSKN
jgi:hypothetical protein